MAYKCTHCGHKQKLKPEDLIVENFETEDTLNNCKKVENNCNHGNSKTSLHLVNNLGPKTSWARRNVLLKHQQQKCMELSSYRHNDHQLLAASPWFQEGLSRDITIEILSDKPVGSFVVRQSRSTPESLALSLRIPAGSISHYLIQTSVSSDNQIYYQIKGSKKLFGSLVSLVTHHSVMPENLPCALLIEHPHQEWKNNGEEFIENHDRDFADTDLDDYSNLVLTLRKSISSSTSDISLTSMD